MDDRVSVFIIGAPKCATSAVATALEAHPQVNFAIGKEPRFFSHDKHRRGFDWYHGCFPRRQGVKIDGSTTYAEAWCDRSAVSARRIHEYNPDARIVYCVRSPLARAVSEWHEYGHQLRIGNPSIARIAGMETYGDLDADLRRIPEFLGTSNYWQRLGPYRERFPDERIHVVFQEDWRRAPLDVLAGLLRFIGVDEGWSCPAPHAEVNDRWLKAKPRLLLDLMLRLPGYRRVAALIPEPARPVLRRVLKRRPIDASAVSPDVVAYAWESLHQDIDRFLRWAGRDVGMWGRGAYR